MIDIQRIRNNIINYHNKKKEQHYKEKDKRRNSRWNKYYGSKYWQQLRNNYYALHPCCECCEKLNIVTPTEEIHHKKRFSSGITEEAKWRLLLNDKNLIALCAYHHKLAHKYMEINNTDTAGIDEILKMDKVNNI